MALSRHRFLGLTGAAIAGLPSIVRAQSTAKIMPADDDVLAVIDVQNREVRQVPMLPDRVLKALQPKA